MKKINNFWVDKNNNKWNCAHNTKEKAIIKSKTLIHCSNCSDCSGCSRCSDCSYCSYCSDCSGCSGCSGCSDCSDCSDCSYCSGCSGCSRYKENPQRYFSKKIGSRKSQTQIYWTDINDIQIITGCFNGTLKEFEEAIIKNHKKKSIHYVEYMKLIEKIKYLTN